MSAFRLQLEAALQGNFDKELEAGRKSIEAPLQRAVFETGGDLQAKLAQDAGRLGPRVGRTWRRKTYPNSGMNPAVLVYSKFPRVISAFETGVEIRSKRGLYILIPNRAVWGKRPKKRPAAEMMAAATARFGRLRTVFPKHRRDLGLVLAEVRKGTGKRGGYRKASDRARSMGQFETQAVFFLVKAAKIPRLLRGDVIRARVIRDADKLIAEKFVRYFEQGGQSQLQLQGPSE